MAQVAPELMTFTVQVPDNAPPGALVQFTAPNGQSVQAQIPPGLGPGAQFTIAVPAAVLCELETLVADPFFHAAADPNPEIGGWVPMSRALRGATFCAAEHERTRL